MGLMEIHLIILAAKKVWPSLRGRAVIYSDCLGALERVANLPPHRIPTKCWHLDILKNILVDCTSLSFILAYSHVKAHQDNHKEFSTLPRPAQLNKECYLGILRRATAKAEVFSAGTDISLGWGRQDDVRYVKATEVLGA